MTESRLRNIIRESINRLLLMEYHNQLRIPFEEFGNGHAFIDEFIDWIQYSSEKGVLPKPTITWEEGLRKGYEEYAKKGNNEWESYDSFRDLIKTEEDAGFFEFDKNGNLYVERSITMPAPNGNINSEDSTLYQRQIDKYEKNVGGCWAVGHGNSEAYCGDENDDTTIVLKGYMFLDDIYWEEFVRLWSRPDPEYEVRTYPNGRVMLTEIQVDFKTLSMKSFDGPRILKSTFFGNNATFGGDFAALDYQNYSKFAIDRQGNEYTEKEFSQQIQRLLNNGEKPEDIFNECEYNSNGFVRVVLSSKHNFIKPNGELLSPNQWFDICGNFHEGFAGIYLYLYDRFNFINQKGEVIYKPNEPDQWFDWVWEFENGFGRVSTKDGKWNFIDGNGNILYKPNEPDQWFDKCNSFKRGVAKVVLNDEWRYIDRNGNFVDERPQVSESLIRNVIRESIISYINMDMI